MCGRFTQHYTWAEVYAFLELFGPPRNLRPRYNIAPTTSVDVVRLDRDGQRELVSMRWGLVPFFWKKSLKDVPATFNARVETVAEKPMFRDAFRKRRCIVPASGFYEWTGEKGAKQPHLFTAADGSPVLAFAGLWDRWHDKDTGEEVLSCTHCVRGECLDGALSRPDAGPAERRSDRRLAGWDDACRRPGASRRGGLARMAGDDGPEPHWRG